MLTSWTILSEMGNSAFFSGKSHIEAYKEVVNPKCHCGVIVSIQRQLSIHPYPRTYAQQIQKRQMMNLLMLL